MSIDRFFTTAVEILRPGTANDAYGDAQPDWGAATSRDTLGWLVQQSSTEVVDGRDAVTTDAVLFLAADDTIGPQDRVVTATATYEVVGRPQPAPTPRGTHHVEVALRTVEG